MDVDEQVYIGDLVFGVMGFVNVVLVMNISNVIVGNWGLVMLVQMFVDVNELLNSVWVVLVYVVCLECLLIDLLNFLCLNLEIVSSVGNISILQFLKNNLLLNVINGCLFEIYLLKWLMNCGVSNMNCMVVYMKDKNCVCFLFVLLQCMLFEYCDICQFMMYFGWFGVVEVVYLEIIGYCDGV